MKNVTGTNRNLIMQKQAKANHLLYLAFIIKGIATVFDMGRLLGGIIPNSGAIGGIVSFLNFVSGLILLFFFVIELFFMPPLGMTIMCIMISLTFFVLPYAVVTIVSLMVESFILIFFAGIVCYALSGILVTVVCGWITSIEVISVTAPLAIATGISAAVAGTGAAAAQGAKAAIDGAGRFAGRGKISALSKFIGSLLVLLVIGWPAMSATNAITGVIACKPAVIASQSFFNHMNMTDIGNSGKRYQKMFEEEKDWVFGSNFYPSYINNGTNNIVQGEKDMIAGNEDILAILLNGLLYVQEQDITGLHNGAGYLPRKTDALILVDSTAFMFGYNKVFVCGREGQYTWKKTKWTSEFEKLSEEEQFECIYDILESQNTKEERKFFYDEVGMVAYAQRNGLLLDYDSESHEALFASKDKEGRVTVYRQRKSGDREEEWSFTPTFTPGEGLPYYVPQGENGIVYLDGNMVQFISLDERREASMFTCPDTNGEKAKLISLHQGDFGENGKYIVYLEDENNIWFDLRLIGNLTSDRENWSAENTRVSGFAGQYFYSIQYDDDLLSRLTYVKDYISSKDSDTKGWGTTEIRTENWRYQRLLLKQSTFNPELAEQEHKEAEKAEEERQNDPAVKYPAPEVKSRENRELYDKTYIAASNYSTYEGPQKEFCFRYPERLYDNVDYTLENEGSDITIVFTCEDDPSYLEVSMHPLPEEVKDIKSYAREWCDRELKELYNGLENNFKEYDGEIRFRIQGWTEMYSGVQSHVICRVDDENIMKMVLRFPNGTDDEDKAVKTFYHKRMNYYCGFGIPTEAPRMK